MHIHLGWEESGDEGRAIYVRLSFSLSFSLVLIQTIPTESHNYRVSFHDVFSTFFLSFHSKSVSMTNNTLFCVNVMCKMENARPGVTSGTDRYTIYLLWKTPFITHTHKYTGVTSFWIGEPHITSIQAQAPTNSTCTPV